MNDQIAARGRRGPYPGRKQTGQLPLGLARYTPGCPRRGIAKIPAMELVELGGKKTVGTPVGRKEFMQASNVWSRLLKKQSGRKGMKAENNPRGEDL